MLHPEVVERSLFSATLSCSLNNLSEFGWRPKYLVSRERHADRGLTKWVQNNRPKISKVAKTSLVMNRERLFEPKWSQKNFLGVIES